jgi:DNA processing protein
MKKGKNSKYEITTISPEEYPVGLRNIPQPPKELWVQGKFPPIETKFLTVVGSRALSRYGREACEMLIGGLSGYPSSIVSGLALGADACAHTAALVAGLHTIAIPGGGLATQAIMPRSNLGLAHKILKSGGLLLSEHPPDYLPHSYDFPARNRIMVGLADAVLIIEAGQKSGTLITARLAVDYNRDLLFVPHRIGDPHGYGGHFFMREGGTMVIEPLHILEALHITPRENDMTVLSTGVGKLSVREKQIYELVSEARSRDELIRASNLPAQEVLTILITLEIKGLVKEEFGTWHKTSA